MISRSNSISELKAWNTLTNMVYFVGGEPEIQKAPFGSSSKTEIATSIRRARELHWPAETSSLSIVFD